MIQVKTINKWTIIIKLKVNFSIYELLLNFLTSQYGRLWLSYETVENVDSRSDLGRERKLKNCVTVRLFDLKKKKNRLVGKKIRRRRRRESLNWHNRDVSVVRRNKQNERISVAQKLRYYYNLREIIFRNVSVHRRVSAVT